MYHGITWKQSGERYTLLSIFAELSESGPPQDAILWAIAAVSGKLYFYNDTFIEFRRHDSNASNSIDHGYKYKVNEIYRTRKVNDWYCKSQYFDEGKQDVIDGCNLWCDYRKKLLVEKNLLYWFRLYPPCGSIILR